MLVHVDCIRLLDPARHQPKQHRPRKGRCSRPFHLHCLLWCNLAAAPLVVPGRDQPPQDTRQGKRHLDLFQLALELHYRHGE